MAIIVDDADARDDPSVWQNARSMHGKLRPVSPIIPEPLAFPGLANLI